jgi:hypothetical protein
MEQEYWTVQLVYAHCHNEGLINSREDFHKFASDVIGLTVTEDNAASIGQGHLRAIVAAAKEQHEESPIEMGRAILIKPDGTEQNIRPANGRRFTKGQVRHLLGTFPIYLKQVGDSYMHVGEDMLFAFEEVYTILYSTESGCVYMRDGHIFTCEPFNERATKIWGNNHNRIHGNVIIIPRAQSF